MDRRGLQPIRRPLRHALLEEEIPGGPVDEPLQRLAEALALLGGEVGEERDRLYAAQAVTVLPGSYLARDAHGTNPGTNRVRIALVSSTAECAEAARRIRDFAATLKK